MAGYWTSSFLRFCLGQLKMQKGTRPIYSYLDRTSLVNNRFIIWTKTKHFLAGPTREIQRGQDIDAQIANQNAGFASSCLLTDSAR